MPRSGACRRSKADSRQMAVGAIGASASILLHLALLAPVIWGQAGKQPQTRPPLTARLSREGQADDIALEWVAIDESTNANSNRTSTPTLSPPQLKPVAVIVDRPELASVLDETPTVANRSADSDSATASALRGQYIGQINARIDRAWLRPRAPIGDDRFVCQVRIEQDKAGNVMEVALEHCNGNARWQLSLVHAIESASPLPAPPDPSVFARAIHMSFQAVPVEIAVSHEQYEPGT
jgi:TonB-like protein